jgi:hypothetical protein
VISSTLRRTAHASAAIKPAARATSKDRPRDHLVSSSARVGVHVTAPEGRRSPGSVMAPL